MKQPIFKKYCESDYCSPSFAKRHKLYSKGDGYKQICHVCGWIWDPESNMTCHEKNQHMIDKISIWMSKNVKNLIYEEELALNEKPIKDKEQLKTETEEGGYLIPYNAVDKLTKLFLTEKYLQINNDYTFSIKGPTDRILNRNKKCDCSYCQGKKAFEDGKQPEDCPYPEGSRDHWRWLDGYIDADAQESGDFD